MGDEDGEVDGEPEQGIGTLAEVTNEKPWLCILNPSFWQSEAEPDSPGHLGQSGLRAWTRLRSTGRIIRSMLDFLLFLIESILITSQLYVYGNHVMF